jgi:rhodanese-related sulfurtransferase
MEGEQLVALILPAASVLVICLLVAICIAIWSSIWLKRAANLRDIEQHSVTAEALRTLLASNPEVLLYDVRQPLDLLANSEIIPGAKRIPPKDVLENPSLIPKEKDSIVYCTCPSDKTSREILQRTRALHFSRIKFLKGGLAAWKAEGYPVEPYNQPFHL